VGRSKFIAIPGGLLQAIWINSKQYIFVFFACWRWKQAVELMAQ
jgi:hypothetical protein